MSVVEAMPTSRARKWVVAVVTTCCILLTLLSSGIALASEKALNLSSDRENEAHDGNENTSANILNDDGYITFDLGDLQIDASTGLSYIVGQANGWSASVVREFLKDDLTRIQASSVTISGWKAEYTAAVPADAAYVRFTALSGAIVCFYEVGPNLGGSGGASTTSLSLSAERENEAYDGSENTSANILNDDGYITFNLGDLQIDAGTGLRYTVGQANGGSASVTRAFLRADLTQIEASTISISGWKTDYAATVPADAAYLRFTALSGAIICFYEVGPSD